ncbi:arylformamidase [Lottiidibacillus patelloidae]|uniref:Kynurenine formamidase n=1 Tax=Lottiidibacillus patelloidae TaxID=2670334 RepID=A0A263BSM6_9BACI|nr:arylformamidase [Lottiidibacillus patelloidae]OZM56699.1 arylformamidase [Lottiidibacillus patelloidae]
MSLIDISRPLQKGVPNWPGDTEFNYEVSWSKEQSGSVNVGKITMSIHTGTHIDSPFHFDNEGKKVKDLDINIYVGEALVVDMTGKDSIGADDLKHIDFEGVERILLKTNSWKDATIFPETITYLRPDIGQFLSEQGVRLIGVDVPSVDPLNSKELEAHHGLHKHEIYILEGINLEHIVPGRYELMALPLALSEADGSPVRAVLKPIL